MSGILLVKNVSPVQPSLKAREFELILVISKLLTTGETTNKRS